jgi:hypothetical protein
MFVYPAVGCDTSLVIVCTIPKGTVREHCVTREEKINTAHINILYIEELELDDGNWLHKLIFFSLFY